MSARTIVVAEDDEFLRRALEVALTRHGFTVVAAADGLEALRTVRARKPDLLMLDLLMPHMTGVEVLEAVRHDADPDICATPVLILSNAGQDAERHTVERLGVAGYWIKANVSLRELGERIRSLLRPGPDRADAARAPAPAP